MKRVMTSTALLLATLLLLASRDASATEVGGARRFGLGFALGSPTSFVGKLFLNSQNAIDFGVGFGGYGWGRRRDCWDRSRGYYDCDYGLHAFTLNADYLWQEPLARGTAKLDWHIGVGGRMWIFDTDRYKRDRSIDLAVRMPVGLDLTFDRPEFLEVFLELAPAVYIVPGAFEIEAFLGVRFYF